MKFNSIKTIDELLGLDEKDFISATYYLLLGREPDQEGLSYYSKKLKQNGSKIDIVASISGSAEAKPRRHSISGLNEAVSRHKRLKTPIIGKILRFAGGENFLGQEKRKGTSNDKSKNWTDLLVAPEESLEPA